MSITIFVGLQEDPDVPYAFDACTNVECFATKDNSWALGPAHALADLAELLGLENHTGDSSDDPFETAYGIVLDYLQSAKSAVIDDLNEDLLHAEQDCRWVIWAEDEPIHAARVVRPGEFEDDHDGPNWVDVTSWRIDDGPLGIVALGTFDDGLQVWFRPLDLADADHIVNGVNAFHVYPKTAKWPRVTVAPDQFVGQVFCP